jgi:hypothetical protein
MMGSAGAANRDNCSMTKTTVRYCITDNTASAADLLISIY